MATNCKLSITCILTKSDQCHFLTIKPLAGTCQSDYFRLRHMLCNHLQHGVLAVIVLEYPQPLVGVQGGVESGNVVVKGYELLHPVLYQLPGADAVGPLHDHSALVLRTAQKHGETVRGGAIETKQSLNNRVLTSLISSANR